jgi:hypothetical protein
MQKNVEIGSASIPYRVRKGDVAAEEPHIFQRGASTSSPLPWELSSKRKEKEKREKDVGLIYQADGSCKTRQQ